MGKRGRGISPCLARPAEMKIETGEMTDLALRILSGSHPDVQTTIRSDDGAIDTTVRRRGPDGSAKTNQRSHPKQNSILICERWSPRLTKGSSHKAATPVLP